MRSAKIERSIQNVAVFLEMEDFSADADCIELCRLLLEDKISMEEYLAHVTPKDEQRMVRPETKICL